MRVFGINLMLITIWIKMIKNLPENGSMKTLWSYTEIEKARTNRYIVIKNFIEIVLTRKITIRIIIILK
jgi:hypothetical protein